MTADESLATAAYYRSIGITFNLTGVGTLLVAVVETPVLGPSGQVYLSTVAAMLGVVSAGFLVLAAVARRRGPTVRVRHAVRTPHRVRVPV